MAYSDAQALAKAKQIFNRFGLLIHLACEGTIIEESFLAGFIGVEAGIDRKGQIKPEATRFEAHVFQKLRAVRDGILGSYNKITAADLRNAGDDALRNLATSYGLSQIMGWHLIKNLKGQIADLRDPDKHLRFTVQLLLVTAKTHLLSKRFDNVLRIWNTGSANGKTYHDDYVENALKVKKFYESILKQNKNSFAASSAARVNHQNHINAAIPAPMSVIDDADESTGSLKTDVPASAHQTAENITNVNNGENRLPENFQPTDKTVDAPPPSGMMKKAWIWVLSLGIVPPSAGAAIETIRNVASDGALNLKDSLLIAGQIGKFVFPYVVYLAIAFVVFWGIKEILKQISLIVKIYVAGRGDMNNVEIKPVTGDAADNG